MYSVGTRIELEKMVRGDGFSFGLNVECEIFQRELPIILILSSSHDINWNYFNEIIM